MIIADRIGRSLRARLFLTTGGVVLVTVLAAVGLTALRARQVAQDWVREVLDSAQNAQARFERQRSSRLRLVSRFVAGDPNFVAYVAEGDPASVRDLLIERQRDLECDLAAVLDTRGRVVARTDSPAGVGDDLSAHPVVAGALGGRIASGMWSDGRRWWTVVAEPLVSGAELAVGILITGLAVDETMADEVRRQSHAEVAYVALGATPRVIAATLGEERELEAALMQRLARAGAAATGRPPARIDAAGRAWTYRVTALRPGGGEEDPGPAAPAGDGPVIVAVTLASIDEAVAPFRRIHQALLVVGLFSLAGAFALSYALADRVTRPVVRLANAAEAARRGQLDGPVLADLRAARAGGGDEVCRLSRAFESLLDELRAERESQACLETLWRVMPDPEAAAGGDPGPLRPGSVLGGRFEILSRLGAGGVGVVYRALDRELGEAVALKTLQAGGLDPAGLADLKSELRLTRRITHPNVLRTHDFGEAGGLAFISMELVRGETLRVLLDHLDRLPVSVAVRLTRQLLGGLGAAHALGVLHRDIKPENLILDPTGRLRVMDFGIARIARGGARRGDEALSGTLGYVAPEVLRGEPADQRSDLYAVGVVLYEMLAGRRPFEAADTDELCYRMLNEPPPPPRGAAPDLSEALERVVLRCLAADPAERYATAGALGAALEEMPK